MLYAVWEPGYTCSPPPAAPLPPPCSKTQAASASSLTQPDHFTARKSTFSAHREAQRSRHEAWGTVVKTTLKHFKEVFFLDYKEDEGHVKSEIGSADAQTRRFKILPLSVKSLETNLQLHEVFKWRSRTEDKEYLRFIKHAGLWISSDKWFGKYCLFVIF